MPGATWRAIRLRRRREHRRPRPVAGDRDPGPARGPGQGGRPGCRVRRERDDHPSGPRHAGRAGRGATDPGRCSRHRAPAVRRALRPPRPGEGPHCRQALRAGRRRRRHWARRLVDRAAPGRAPGPGPRPDRGDQRAGHVRRPAGQGRRHAAAHRRPARPAHGQPGRAARHPHGARAVAAAAVRVGGGVAPRARHVRGHSGGRRGQAGPRRRGGRGGGGRRRQQAGPAGARPGAGPRAGARPRHRAGPPRSPPRSLPGALGGSVRRLSRSVETLRSVLRFGPLERDPVARRLARAAAVADLRAIARRRLPRGVFDYIDGGAEDERTLAANAAAYARVTFRPRVLRDVGTVDPSTTLLGRPLPLPLVLAPTGFTRIADPDGELAVARAAVSAGPKWFQVYMWRDRGLVKEIVGRAAEAGYEAVVLTVDAAVLGRRERDVRRGFTLPPQIGLGTLVDGALHPAWTFAFVRSEPIRFANVTGREVSDGSSAVSLADYVNTQFDPALSWRDVEWLRSAGGGPLVLKGVQTVADARLAADAGVEAVALSNHGGRQLDSAPAPLDLVAPVADAVGDRVEIICDGGVRRGSDIVKAVALGARACMAGRAYLYGLGAAGERGVDHVLRLFDADVRRTMALVGARTVGDLT